MNLLRCPRISIRDQDRLVASVPGPSLLYAADGTGGASSSLPNLVVSLPTVAINEVVEINLPILHPEQSSSQSSIYTKYLELQIRMLQQASTLQGPSINSDEFSASQSCSSNSNQLGYIQTTPSSVTTRPVVAPQGPSSSKELGNQQGPTSSREVVEQSTMQLTCCGTTRVTLQRCVCVFLLFEQHASTNGYIPD